jgi:hypothetical protein
VHGFPPVHGFTLDKTIELLALDFSGHDSLVHAASPQWIFSRSMHKPYGWPMWGRNGKSAHAVFLIKILGFKINFPGPMHDSNPSRLTVFFGQYVFFFSCITLFTAKTISK